MTSKYSIFHAQEIASIEIHVRELQKQLRATRSAITYHALEADVKSIAAAVDAIAYFESEILRCKLRIVELRRAFLADQYKHFQSNQSEQQQ